MAVAVAGCFATTSARATIEYFEWVNDTAWNLPGTGAIGTLTYDTVNQVVDSISFQDYNSTATYTPDTTYVNGSGHTYAGTGTLMTAAPNLILQNRSTGGSEPYHYTGFYWNDNSGLDENKVSFDSTTIEGDWVPYTPVPEATTILSGVLMLLPFGASALRILRKRQVA